MQCHSSRLLCYAIDTKRRKREENKNRNPNKKQVLSIRTNKRFNTTDYEFEWIDSQTPRRTKCSCDAIVAHGTSVMNAFHSTTKKKGSERYTVCEYAPYISNAVCASIYPYPTLLWFSWRSSIFFFRVGWQPSGVSRCACNTRNRDRISLVAVLAAKILEFCAFYGRHECDLRRMNSIFSAERGRSSSSYWRYNLN